MQKFENKDRVNVKGFTGVCKWISEGLYDGKDIIASSTGKLAHVPKENIRPAQLICDEARRYLITCDKTKNYLFKVDSEAQSKELLRMLFDCGICWGDGTIEMKHTGDVSEYDCYCVNNKRLFRQDNMITATNYNELNLKTGDVIPCDKVPSDCIYEDDPRYNGDLTHHHKVPVENKGVDMTIESAYKIIAELRNELKEKDVEITEQKRIIDGDLLARTEDRAEDKAEIERLKEWNKDMKNFLKSKIEDYLE